MSIDKELHLDTTRKVRALASPLRRRFIELLIARGAASVREVALEMARPPATLYYHLRQLEDAGLVRAVGERATGKRPETLYEAVASHLRLSPEDPAEATWYAELERYVRNSLRAMERAIANHVEDPGFDRSDPAPTMHFRTAQVRLDEPDRMELARRIEELTRFLVDADGRAPTEAPNLTLAIAMAPTGN